MKTNIIGIIVALMLAFAGAVGLYAQDSYVSQERKVENFSSIELVSVGNIYFTQGDKCSLRIEGMEKYVTNTTTRVEAGRLYIDTEKKNGKKRFKNRKGREVVKIYITAPDLKELDFEGVGNFNCKEPLKLDNVEMDIEGVGDINIADLTCRTLNIDLSGVGGADIHVNCDLLEADMDGVGSITLSGKAGKARISKDGIGSVNTKKLKIGK